MTMAASAAVLMSASPTIASTTCASLHVSRTILLDSTTTDASVLPTRNAPLASVSPTPVSPVALTPPLAAWMMDVPALRAVIALLTSVLPLPACPLVLPALLLGSIPMDATAPMIRSVSLTTAMTTLAPLLVLPMRLLEAILTSASALTQLAPSVSPSTV
jgi:hypothetical protein